jgi:hypothetical protein
MIVKKYRDFPEKIHPQMKISIQDYIGLYNPNIFTTLFGSPYLLPQRPIF